MKQTDHHDLIDGFLNALCPAAQSAANPNKTFRRGADFLIDGNDGLRGLFLLEDLLGETFNVHSACMMITAAAQRIEDQSAMRKNNITAGVEVRWQRFVDLTRHLKQAADSKADESRQNLQAAWEKTAPCYQGHMQITAFTLEDYEHDIRASQMLSETLKQVKAHHAIKGQGQEHISACRKQLTTYQRRQSLRHREETANYAVSVRAFHQIKEKVMQLSPKG